ncbi:Endonuclease-reverse transcriptase [Popillia japonica]|uniref:Endonuclease-reverse transcriptase n=1 Tax=Popillia japonica TaxID=7064 RepID=A0AAW1HFJ1_POPJA
MQLVALGNINADYLRKCTEFAFRRTHKNIGIVMEKQTKPRTQVAKQLEKVIIKADGKQYADILRTVKGSVNIDKAGIMVNARGTKVEIKNKNDTVFLTGIDGDVGKDEIVQAIKDSIGGEMQLQDIEIVSIRPTQYGGQNATVVLNKQWAIELCKRGTIRIGWTPCHVRQRINITRCYRCLEFGHHKWECKGKEGWTPCHVRQRINITRCYRCLEFGHHKWECKGKDNTSTCLKCGNSDHRAKECTGESYCLTCKKNGHRADQTRCGTRTDVAALILTKNVEVIGHSAGDGHLVLELETCDIVCCYVSPNIEMHQYELEVDNIMNRIDRRQTIVLGDINAKSPQWGASRTDKKGAYWLQWIHALDMVVLNTGREPTAYWLQWIHALDMVVLNTGREPTFVRGQTKFGYGGSKHGSKEGVLDQDSLTEHNYISFEIKGAKKERSIGKGKPITTVDWDRFRRSIRTMADETEAQEHDQCTRLIQAAYRKSTQKQCNTTNTPYWWNENIDKKRKQCKRRKAANDAKEAYKVCKKDLVKTIRDTKWQCWKRLCAELDTNIWGDAYRIVTKKFGMLAPYDLSIDKRRQILCVLFPPSLEKLGSGAPAGNVPPFTADELECATVSMKPGKAPGLECPPLYG